MRLLLCLPITLALVLPAAAAAAIPATGTIVEGRGLSTLLLGDSPADADAALGAPAACTEPATDRSFSCSYQRQYSTGTAIRVRFSVAGATKTPASPEPTVSAIEVFTSGYATTKGIALGATSARVRGVYPKAASCGLQTLCLNGRDALGRRTVTRFHFGLTSATSNYLVGITVTV